jgi:hypothetical protein
MTLGTPTKPGGPVDGWSQGVGLRADRRFRILYGQDKAEEAAEAAARRCVGSAANLEFMQKANAVVHSAAGDKVQDGAGGMGNKLARFFEMRGTAGDDKVFQAEAEKMVRAMVFTGGNFNPSEAFNFAQQTKGALQNYDISFLGSVAPSLDRDGRRPRGHRRQRLAQYADGKVRDQKPTAEWVKLGLLDPKMVAGGRAARRRAGARVPSRTPIGR